MNRVASRVVIYFAIQACGADGELHDGEIATIVRMGALLDVSEDIVKRLVGIYHEERALRERRIKLALPDGVPAA